MEKLIQTISPEEALTMSFGSPPTNEDGSPITHENGELYTEAELEALDEQFAACFADNHPPRDPMHSHSAAESAKESLLAANEVLVLAAKAVRAAAIAYRQTNFVFEQHPYYESYMKSLSDYNKNPIFGETK